MARLCGVLLALLPLLTGASPSFNEDYSDYNDRIVINPGTDPLDYAAIYEGVFSYENIIIMQIQNLFTYVVTTLAWGAVQETDGHLREVRCRGHICAHSNGLLFRTLYE